MCRCEEVTSIAINFSSFFFVLFRCFHYDPLPDCLLTFRMFLSCTRISAENSIILKECNNRDITKNFLFEEIIDHLICFTILLLIVI